jgi:penicillin-binding protein 1A
MEKIHKGLADAPIINESPGELGLVKRRVCTVSGLLATDACEMDSSGHTPVTDWFLEENAPTETCDVHVVVNVCSESGQQATTNCPPFGVVQKSVVLIRSDSPYMKFDPKTLKEGIPNAVFTDTPIEQYSSANYDPSGLCTLHGSGWSQPLDPADLSEAVSQAEVLIGTVELYMANTPDLTWSETTSLNSAINTLEGAIQSNSATNISAATSQLMSVYNTIAASHISPAETGEPNITPTPGQEPAVTPSPGLFG